MLDPVSETVSGSVCQTLTEDINCDDCGQEVSDMVLRAQVIIIIQLIFFN